MGIVGAFLGINCTLLGAAFGAAGATNCLDVPVVLATVPTGTRADELSLGKTFAGVFVIARIGSECSILSAFISFALAVRSNTNP